jgi:hypothetical protein
MSDTYGAQEAQDLITLEVTIEGFENWRDAFTEEIEFTGFWAQQAGKDHGSLLEACDIAARLNRISREVQYFSQLINEGYALEEAVVTYDQSEWGKFGKCTWLKNHASYSDPEVFWRKINPEASDYSVSLVAAYFNTENAGEQRATLSSSALSSGFLFHKTLRFHRMVFSKPRTEESIAV